MISIELQEDTNGVPNSQTPRRYFRKGENKESRTPLFGRWFCRAAKKKGHNPIPNRKATLSGLLRVNSLFFENSWGGGRGGGDKGDKMKNIGDSSPNESLVRHPQLLPKAAQGVSGLAHFASLRPSLCAGLLEFGSRGKPKPRKRAIRRGFPPAREDSLKCLANFPTFPTLRGAKNPKCLAKTCSANPSGQRATWAYCLGFRFARAP